MKQTLIGVISDTHGLLRPEVFGIFKNVDLIIHAGDIGNPDVIAELRTIAPVFAVRGNNDTGPWAKRIPEFRIVKAGAASIYVLHDVKELDTNSIGKSQVVVSGHSHRPGIERRNGILYLNPGSAGPRRFKLPISIARLTVRDSSLRAELIELNALDNSCSKAQPSQTTFRVVGAHFAL